MEMFKYMKSGMKPKQAAARMLADKRKMAKGGAVEGDYNLGEEHERNLAVLAIEGDQPPIANPEEQSQEKRLAMNLQKAAEEKAYYAMGGFVENMDGNEEPEPEHGVSSEPRSELPSAPLEHSLIEGVPRIEPGPLSEEAKKALEYKKKMRRFR